VHRLIADERDRCVAWVLLCDADSHAWHALLWELALGVNVVNCPNPFEPLVELYELGYFPMGWTGNSYELYVPLLSPMEARGFAENRGKDERRGENYLSWADELQH
jgi:hypothetical protein